MLGGRRSFGDGGWAETEIADLLPVEIPVRASGDVPRAAVEVRLAPTPLGLTHPVTQIGADAGETQCEPHRRSEAHGLWTLLVGASLGGEQAVLANQRYGLGRVLALTAQDSWQWSLSADVTGPALDLERVHATFWQQTLHWLADSTAQ